MKKMRLTPLGAFVAVAWLATLPGCKGPQTGLVVDLRAEPKQGYTPPEAPTYGGDADGQHDHNYHLIDYSNLPGVVVWVEPKSGQTLPAKQQTPPAVEVNLAGAPGTVYATGVGGRVVLKNIAKSPQTVLLRGPAGELTEMRVGASAQMEHSAGKPGLLEVIRDEDDEPIANVYVAPTPLVRVGRGGQSVTFAPLPPGTYAVTAWHPILPGATTTVTVSEGQTAKAALTVGVNSLPKAK